MLITVDKQKCVSVFVEAWGNLTVLTQSDYVISLSSTICTQATAKKITGL